MVIKKKFAIIGALIGFTIFIFGVYFVNLDLDFTAMSKEDRGFIYIESMLFALLGSICSQLFV